MKKKTNDILDGITPEELDAFRESLREEAAPADVDTARIASLVAGKTGLACGDTARAGTDAPAGAADPARGSARILRRRLLISAAAALCAAALLLAFLPAMLRGKERNGALSDDPALWDGVLVAHTAQTSDAPEKSAGSASEEGASEDEEIYPASPMTDVPEKRDSLYYSGIEVLDAEADVSAEQAERVRASMLTAKEYRDLDHFADWKSQLNDNGWYSLVTARGIRADKMTEVRVTYGGKPVYNTRVELLGAQGTLFTAVTDVQGRAYLFYALSSQDQDVPTAVRVGETVYDLPAGGTLEIEAADAGISVTELDLMLMVDTTGSMGDEIAYLRAELEDTVKRVAAAGRNLSIRVSVNFYRDEGDEYVVKYYGFRSDVQECVRLIAAERADGGGDFPEAVHTALDNAVNGHNWRDNAVKLCFFVLDAPPHNTQEINESLRQSLTAAAGCGVRILSVVSSGADADCEYVMRSAAVLTGGTYVYLTDESGIGGSHKEAEIDKDKEKQTEYLNDCMVRLICEYCGVSE